MKFTKQEQSLIKLAAAHMAPQMVKKATLQDKLAEYGIGMSKKAAAAPSYMNALNPLTRMPIAAAAQAGATLGSAVAGRPVSASMQGSAIKAPVTGNRGDVLTVKEDNRELDPMYFGGTPYTDAMRAKYAEIMNNDKWQKFKWRQQRADAARGAINEIKTNGWPAVGMSPYTPAQMRAKGYPVYGNRFFKDLANLVRSPQDLNDSIEKMNREGVAPDTRRSDHTGLSSTFRANPRILAPQK